MRPGKAANRRNAAWLATHKGLIIKTLNDFEGFTDDTAAEWDPPSHLTQKSDAIVYTSQMNPDKNIVYNIII